MSGEFTGLLEEGRIGEVVRGFERAVASSFAQDHGPQTQAEIKRRIAICQRLFRALRGDEHWSVQRVLDYLPRYLRFELDGVPWVPDTANVWTPEGRSS